MRDHSQPYKKISALKTTMIVILIVSTVYSIIFAYINDEMTMIILGRELILSPLRLGGIGLITYAIIWLLNRLNIPGRLSFSRYFFELPVILFFTYWWLLFVAKYVEAPIVCHCTDAPTDTWVFRQYIGLFFIATVFVYVFQSGLNFYQLAQEKAAEVERYEREVAMVSLQALRNQVNPHFLFNSLSVLTSLVHISAETSDRFIQQLSKAYRYILDQKELEWVTLQSELDFLDSYFYLLQIRFEAKVQLVKNLDLDAHQYKLPPLTLQLLIENVVKHNKMSANEPLTISIQNQDDYLVVRNNINKREQHESSTGIGLQNIQKRYAYISDKKIEIEKNETEFIIRLPLLKA